MPKRHLNARISSRSTCLGDGSLGLTTMTAKISSAKNFLLVKLLSSAMAITANATVERMCCPERTALSTTLRALM